MTMMDFTAERRRIQMIREQASRRRGGSDHNAAKTHCPANHPYAGNNVVLRLRHRDGLSWVERRCVECQRKQKGGGKRRR